MRFEEMTSPDIDALDRDATVALVPMGSVEQHGLHMPVGTDSLVAHALCLAVAERRPDILVMPPPWYGFSAHHMRFAGTVSLRADTMMALIGDVVGSLVAHGFRRVLMVNGHGGNAGLVDVLAATLGHRHQGEARIAGTTYFHLAREAIDAIRDSGPGGAGHACEVETSLMLHLDARLVRSDRAAATYPDPGSAYLTTDLTGSSAVRTYLDFADLSPTGTLGDPGLADAGKGRRLFEAAADALARLAADFVRWPIAPQAN